jgi:hypothetical protein
MTVSRILVVPPVVDQQVLRSGDIRVREENPFYGELMGAAHRELRFEVIDPKKVLAHQKRSSNRLASESDSTDLAKELKADSVLLTTMHRYEERRGNRIAADSPASLSFSMRLVRVADSTELWRASYHFHDEALSENLFRIKEKASKRKEERGWQTAYDVLQRGFGDAMSALAKLRESQFRR